MDFNTIPKIMHIRKPTLINFFYNIRDEKKKKIFSSVLLLFSECVTQNYTDETLSATL